MDRRIATEKLPAVIAEKEAKLRDLRIVIDPSEESGGFLATMRARVSDVTTYDVTTYYVTTYDVNISLLPMTSSIFLYYL